MTNSKGSDEKVKKVNINETSHMLSIYEYDETVLLKLYKWINSCRNSENLYDSNKCIMAFYSIKL